MYSHEQSSLVLWSLDCKLQRFPRFTNFSQALVAPKKQKKTTFKDDDEEMETTEVTMETAE